MQSAPTPAAWAACLAAFERELTPQQYATWIRPLACAERSGRLRLTAPNRFVLQWVKDRFGPRIEVLASEATGEAVAVDFAVADSAAAPSAPAAARTGTPLAAPVDSRSAAAQPAPPATPQGPVATPVPSFTGPRRVEPGGLNPGFTFTSFVAGKANQLARAAGLQVADHPTSYNPLFVYGGVGLGKTHLVQAIGHQILV